ncbi:MAG: polysaccharide biosynthesis/export family protein [Rhodospirillales bacterium]|nr:polysaccharide biosynthesis/export family protein [Rhodospirillales bacterium]
MSASNKSWVFALPRLNSPTRRPTQGQRRWHKLWTFLFIAAGLGAGPLAAADNATPSDRPSASAWSDADADGRSPEYRIGIYDELFVELHGEPDLSRWVIVRPDGYVSVPLAEDVPASGQTPAELAATIAKRMARYLVAPQVFVTVERSAGSAGTEPTASAASTRSVRIIGGSQVPKAIPYQAGMRLFDTIAAAGGFSPKADVSRAVLVRGDRGAVQTIALRLGDLLKGGDAPANIAIEPGDIIVIPDGFFSGEWRHTVSATISNVYTDNYRLDPAGEADPALITALTPSVEIAGSSARMTGALAASLTGEYVALTSKNVRAIPNVVAT